MAPQASQQLSSSTTETPAPIVAPSFSQPDSKPPNVVLILGDDVGVDLVSAYAGFFPPTPAPNTPDTPVLDALAKDGILFRNAWTNPGCSPSRAQILTGRHARRTGIGGLVKHRVPSGKSLPPGLSHDIQLLPQALKSGAAPYDTAAVGKWHLASPGQGALHALGPDGAWFDRWAGSAYNLNGTGVGYRSWPKTFATQIRDDECSGTYPCERTLREGDACENYATVDTTQDALHLINTLQEPFFLYVSYNAPHTPLELPACALPASCSAAELSYSEAPPTEAELTRALVRTMDHEIGRLLCAIDEDDTVVIFIGDNGTAGDDASGQPHGITAPFPGSHGKATVYNAGVNVPLIVRGPGLTHGVSEALVNSTDLFATIVDLAGRSSETAIPRDSVSITPYLHAQPHPAPRETILAERFTPAFTPTNFETGAPPAGYHARLDLRSVRNARFKLIEHDRKGNIESEEFYDLVSGGRLRADGKPGRDDFEQHDLMQRRSSWSPGGEIERNYMALKQTLASELPPLP
jgi:arylsulfatase A-like enzyme